MAAGRIHVGTSGWVYQHWRGPFYPDDLPQTKWFTHYAERYRTVEINNTFYRMPGENAVRRWHDDSPDDFLFAFKASRYITHRKRLNDVRQPVRDFLDRLAPMKEKLGPVLFQTPPFLHLDLDRLRDFLSVLPPREVTYVMEFRHASWYVPEVFDLLGENGVGFCIHDFERWGDPGPMEVTATPIYLRFHGAVGAYHGEYGRDVLRPWAERMILWSRSGHDVYAYFNNDGEAKATVDAALLERLVERRATRKKMSDAR